MDLVSRAAIRIRKRIVTSRNKKYESYYITIPQEFFTDSAFPFTEDDLLIMRIEGDKVVLEKVQETEG